MKIILLLIYIVGLEANSQTSTRENQMYVTPIVIEKVPKSKSNAPKELEVQLRNILRNIKLYKNNNEREKNRLAKELSMLKKKFNDYKIEKEKELKKVKKQLYVSDIKEHEKLKKELYHQNKELDNSQKKLTTIHKVIHKMKSIPTLIHNTPWIEITVKDNINIYDLALKYYGDSQEYTKIYAANRNVINSSYQINSGMSLIIPITENFQEQPVILNSN